MWYKNGVVNGVVKRLENIKYQCDGNKEKFQLQNSLKN